MAENRGFFGRVRRESRKTLGILNPPAAGTKKPAGEAGGRAFLAY
jgi:hypothetical protein